MLSSSRIHAHLRSNVVGYVALFVALSGTAYAVDGPLPGQDQVGSADIIDGEVFRDDLANNSVNRDKIIDGTIRSADVLDQTLSGTDVADDSIKGADVDEASLSGVVATPTGAAGGDLSGAYPNPQIGPDAVAGPEVAADSLGGVDIDEASLIGVPSSPTGAAGGDLTGTYPNPQIAANAVAGPEVAADSLFSGDIGAGAVGSSEVALNSLTVDDVGPSSVGSSEVAPDSLLGVDIATAAVGGAEVADNSLGGADINEANLAGVNADTLDGADSTNLVTGFTDVADTAECTGSLPVHTPSNFEPPVSEFETCVDAFPTLTRRSELFVIASGGWEKSKGEEHAGICLLRIDGNQIGPRLDLGDSSGFGGGHTAEGRQLPFTLQTITGPLNPGSYDVELGCVAKPTIRDNPPTLDVDQASMSVIVLGTG